MENIEFDLNSVRKRRNDQSATKSNLLCYINVIKLILITTITQASD